jgi:hypothetical protein
MRARRAWKLATGATYASSALHTLALAGAFLSPKWVFMFYHIKDQTPHGLVANFCDSL